MEAATAPIRTLEEQIKQALELIEQRRKYPRELVELAVNNGISARLFRYRVRNGWDYERASTLPVSRSNSAMILKEKYGEDYFRRIMDWVFIKIKK